MSASPSTFKRIIRFIWNTINGIRKFILNLFAFGLIAIVIIAAIGISHDEQAKIESGSALVLNLMGTVVEEKRPVDPFAEIMKNKGQNQSDEILLADVLDVIQRATLDNRISHIILSLSKLKGTNISKLQAIGDALNEFKAAGKTVIANGNWYDQNQYYLASFANQVYLNPQGGVQIEGLSSYQMYYKSALDKLKIKAHIFRVGTYKSAVEPFMRDDMSPAAKEAYLTLFTDMWDSYSTKVLANRDIVPTSLNMDGETYLAELDKADGQSSQMALNLKWVDKLMTPEEFRLGMIDTLGKGRKGNSFKQVGFYDYLSQSAADDNDNSRANIAIVVAKGNILNGSQPTGTIGGKSTAALLRKARFDDKIKAVVLRVDSPGGSAFASEQIRQEVIALKKAKKPVVVSMGSYAASGGYWISASADYIYATPTTLTGSIGIFGMITTIEDSLASLGLNTDGVSTSPWSGISVTKGLTPEVKAVIQRHIERGYHDFISLVATERKMSLEDVDAIAQGRVWTGRKAVDLGLVDELGDLQNAVSKAAQLASLSPFDTQVIKQSLSPKEQFMQDIFGSVSSYLPKSMQQSSMIETLIEQWSAIANELDAFDDPNGVYLYCDTCKI